MTHRVIMPDLGQTTSEGKILRWLKKPGDLVAKGDALLEVQTDKVTMEVESYKAGYLRALLVEEGQVASAMSAIAILTDGPEEPCEDHDAAGNHAMAFQRAATGIVDSALSTVPAQPLPGSRSQARPLATPAAKGRARGMGIRLDSLVGTGPDGLITRRDVEMVSGRDDSSTVTLPMAAITAKSAAEIPHFYVTGDLKVSGLLKWRERWNSAHPQLRASLNDVFVRAAALALGDVPNLNVRYHEGKVEHRRTADILLVAAVESGLTLVPIRDPAALSWEAYLTNMRMALESAKENRVKGSLESLPALAVSNLGMFEVKQFTAIIPPGCAAVLAIGAVREEVIVRNKQMGFEEVCTLTLGSDHRAIDGITAARFLQRIQAHFDTL
jgi:pyruvate dehydrogenase E2 component (dihydrolipoamide acetyltransferase)